MSKAFTREDGGGEEGLVPLRPRAPAGTRRYITPEGFRALQEELAALSGPAPQEDAGAPLGHEVQRRERARRAHELAALLDSVQVVSPEEAPAGRVFFGAWVTLEDEEGGTVRWRIVGPDEADVRAGRLSVESPLARALLGREEGDAVRVERPRGTAEYTITEVRYR